MILRSDMEREHEVNGASFREILDPAEMRKTIEASIATTNRKLLETLDKKHIPEGTNIDIQYALRSGYLIHEFGDGRLEEQLEKRGLEVTHSVIGITGDYIYAPPALPKPGSITIVMDTTAGSPTTLIGAAKWHWENRVRSDSRASLPKRWPWKNQSKYYVATLSTSPETIQEVEGTRAKLLPVQALALPRFFYKSLDNTVPGRKLRAFKNPEDQVVLIGDLGDVYYGDAYKSIEEIQALANRFDFFAPGQKEALIRHYHSKIDADTTTS